MVEADTFPRFGNLELYRDLVLCRILVVEVVMVYDRGTSQAKAIEGVDPVDQRYH